MPCWKNIPMHRNGWTRLPPCWQGWEQLAVAGKCTPLYELLTPYVLGMEELPGLKGMKKRLNGEHKVIRTRADEGAALFAQILERSPAVRRKLRHTAGPQSPACGPCLRRCGISMPGSAKKRDRKLLEFSDFEHQALRLLRYRVRPHCAVRGHPAELRRRNGG